MSRTLVWFRGDLRVSDNPALYHCADKNEVIAVYCLCPDQWQEHNDSPNKLWFWMQNLKQLEQSLNRLNIPLVVIQSLRFEHCAQQLLQMARKLECDGISFNNEHGLNEENRDKAVEQTFIGQQLECQRFSDQTLIPPGQLLNGSGDYFKVFTPFKKALYRTLNLHQIQPLPAPEKQKPLKLPEVETFDYQNLFKPVEGLQKLWPAGEEEAANRLKAFIESHGEGYKKFRDFPGIDATSTLSPYLVSGTVSLKQCFYAALQANNGEMDSGSDGLQCWMSELIWREFYKHILHGFPRLSRGRAFITETEHLPWNQDKQAFNAWCKGETGFPLVDAAMKQLVNTGWMHNRLRMVTAMFLSKNLMIDWRLGETFFMQHLIDGDLSANNGGWQWSASTGTDAAPYFRMFNPVSQSEKFDSQGHFIRHWLPQLDKLSSKEIHAPWQKNTHEINYPAPIVDLKASRAKVLSAFKALKQS
ncbi:deoxyribodipyrimidine photo-lyase [Endozoicomonas sp. ALD040]|uniref:deoxyribodipyrimidine photo-lyase n=1 Tax=Endozoicomonas sp. ALD040 TaxID=3403079 RepID=UPI003BAE2679